jgi:hypothetical protein
MPTGPSGWWGFIIAVGIVILLMAAFMFAVLPLLRYSDGK